MELTRMKKEESGYAAYGTYLSSYLSEFKENVVQLLSFMIKNKMLFELYESQVNCTLRMVKIC